MYVLGILPTLGYIQFLPADIHLDFLTTYLPRIVTQARRHAHTLSLYLSHCTLDVVRIFPGTPVSAEVASSRRRFPPTLGVSPPR